jgi:hypothetical protein
MAASSLSFCMALARPASGETPASDRQVVRLSWVRTREAISCPDAGEIETDVIRRLGWSPFGSPASRSIEVSVSKEPARWRADIEVRAPDGSSLGSRSVTSEAATCASLASAAGLAVALMIDPAAFLRGNTEPETPAPAPTTSDAAAAVLDASTPPVSTETEPALSGSLSLVAVFAVRVLPGFAPGAGLFGDVLLGDRGRLIVSAVHLPEQSQSRNEASALFGITWTGLGACYDFVRQEAWSLSACASALVGASHVVAIQPGPFDVGGRFWAAGAMGLRAEWFPSSPLQFRTGVEFVAPFDRRVNSVEWRDPARREELYSEPALGGFGFAGFGVKL